MTLQALHDTAAVIGVAVTLRKAFSMWPRIATASLQYGMIVWDVVCAVEDTGAIGTAKRADAIQRIQVLVNQRLPAWAAKVLNPLIEVGVDSAVAYANHSGFFGHGSSSAPAPSSVTQPTG